MGSYSEETASAIENTAKGNVVQICAVTHDFTTPAGDQMQAVSDINLEIEGGEFVAIVGPSGCGKTTLLNIVSGLIEPTSGLVRVAGELVKGVREDVGYMPARDSLLPWRTCQANVELPLELQGRLGRTGRRERAKALLQAVGLSGFESHYPSALSHGMRQRASVARTFVSHPAVLLMDEPFSALDAQTRVVIQDVFLRIWESEHQSVLLITHDVLEAVALADRVVVLSGRPGTIRATHQIALPRPRLVKQLLFEEPRFQAYVRDIWGDLDA